MQHPVDDVVAIIERTASMNALPTEPCAHAGCGCKVSEPQQYCSDHCRQQGEQAAADGGCRCGHSDCIVQEALQRMDDDH
jgi:hypothetical protein